MADAAGNHWPMSEQSAVTDDDEQQLYFNVSSTPAMSSAVDHHAYKYVGHLPRFNLYIYIFIHQSW